ncbi:hypothetical protein HR45_00340 [Shewanella mangrovi]|uniref:Uncharacterized protein n=1 Tax=Shewanella mangrovi TaxID=1515746 RepID=A0A094JG49_9GAMM|nr:hypothetical protein [Shewanella mangrovi]KFZ38890.1 hypothetical protein HR45_00340 [Shewanella mangrovi]
MIPPEVEMKIQANSRHIKSLATRIHQLEEMHLAEPSNADYVEMQTQQKKLVDENRHLLEQYK